MSAAIDTSGRVRAMPNAPHPANWICWDDLTPFQQGCVEALLSDIHVFATHTTLRLENESAPEVIGFQHLAPETLQRVIADCNRIADVLEAYGHSTDKQAGLGAWELRQKRRYPSFPHLTPCLADDGLIYLREGDQ